MLSVLLYEIKFLKGSSKLEKGLSYEPFSFVKFVFLIPI